MKGFDSQSEELVLDMGIYLEPEGRDREMRCAV